MLVFVGYFGLCDDMMIDHNTLHLLSFVAKTQALICEDQDEIFDGDMIIIITSIFH